MNFKLLLINKLLGLGPTLLRDVPFSAIYWACYEKIMNTFFNHHSRFSNYNNNAIDNNKNNIKNNYYSCESMKQKFISSFFAGAVSGAIAATLTLPFDVVKTYKQIDWTHGSKPQPMRRVIFLFIIIIAVLIIYYY
jgi:hypothetical protein